MISAATLLQFGLFLISSLMLVIKIAELAKKINLTILLVVMEV